MSEAPQGDAETFDIVIVGAGFSGMYLIHKARQLGLSVVALDAASDVGGTWYWNRYPGARCDIESMDYSLSWDEDLQQAWEWTERYSAQPEILRYAEHVADRFDLRRDMRFDTKVVKAAWHDAAALWDLETGSGDHVRGRYCVMATGCLSVPQKSNFPGLDDFTGDWYHTGLWPHEPVDFSGKSVAVIGTGSSAIQSIPQIARQAEHVTVFQRTPNFAVPAWNGPLDPDEVTRIKADYKAFRERARWSHSGYNSEAATESGHEVSDNRRRSEMERRWAQGGFGMLQIFTDEGEDREVNQWVVDFAHEKIRSRVHDPRVADLLCPTNHPFGTKRLCVDIDYYETYNRLNVTLVDISANPVAGITSDGLVLGDGENYTFDAIVLAIGFDAMTGPLMAIDIRGRDDLSLREKWADGPRTYLGLTVAGFPNMFTVTGPQSPSVLTNMITAIEQHVEWISDCIGHMEQNGIATIEARLAEEDAWVEHNNEQGDKTLYPLANSWYVGANMPGKPRVFMPYVAGLDVYQEKCNEIADGGYATFDLSRVEEAAWHRSPWTGGT